MTHFACFRRTLKPPQGISECLDVKVKPVYERGILWGVVNGLIMHMNVQLALVDVASPAHKTPMTIFLLFVSLAQCLLVGLYSILWCGYQREKRRERERCSHLSLHLRLKHVKNFCFFMQLVYCFNFLC